MQITASLDGDTATLTVATINNTANLKVAGAAKLADDIEATLSVGRQDAFRNTYAVLIEPTGCIVKVGPMGVPVPWQHITSVVAALRAE